MMFFWKRRMAGIGILVLSFVLFFALAAWAEGEKTLSQYRISGTEWEKITAGRTETNEELLEALAFNGYDLFYDDETDEWYYSLIEGHPHAQDPYVTFRPIKDNVQVAFETSQITREMLEQDENIKILVYTGTQYHQTTLHCTSLPLMEVTLGDGTTDMSVILFDNRKQAANRLVESDALIHARGGMTRNYPKAGLRISLQQDSVGGSLRKNSRSLLGMRQDEDWILYAAYNDQERVRNVFCSALWYDSCAGHNLFGIQNGMEYRFVELFVNHRYWGLYALGYPIDEKQLGVSKDRKGYSEGCVFKKNSHEKCEWDKKLRHQFPIVGYEIKSTVEDETKAWELLAGFYDKQEDASCPEEIYRLVDVDNVIDVYLFLNLIQGKDNWSKNIFTTFRMYEGEYKAFYTPWDMDISWGNIYDDRVEANYIAPYGYDVKEHKNILDHSALGRLYELGDETLDQKILARYRKLRKDAW